jgi:hypothetical protein
MVIARVLLIITTDDNSDDFISKASAKDEASKTICRWAQLLVTHWESLSILSHYSDCAILLFQVTFLAVKSPDLKPDVCRVVDWKATIKALVKKFQPTLSNGESIDSQEVIEFLSELVKANSTINPIY